MGVLRSRVKGIIVYLVIIFNLVYTSPICTFGPNHTDLLILRNNTIIRHMNATLLNFTNDAVDKFRNYSNFHLWNFLINRTSVTPRNYLEFVSMGRLRNASLWTGLGTVTINVTVKGNGNGKGNGSPNGNKVTSLSGVIMDEFINPIHGKLQNISVHHSFSLGIFRPYTSQIHFTGIVPPPSNSTQMIVLSTNCTAGIYLVWRFSTPFSLNFTIENKETYHSLEFAKIATATDQAFDQYYRTHPNLSNDFVRANVKEIVFGHASLNSSTVIFLEVYFFKTSNPINIANWTSFSAVPPIYYQYDNGSAQHMPINNPVFVGIGNASHSFNWGKSSSTTQVGTQLSSMLMTTTKMIDVDTSATSQSTLSVGTTNFPSTTSAIKSIASSSAIVSTLSSNSSNASPMIPIIYVPTTQGSQNNSLTSLSSNATNTTLLSTQSPEISGNLSTMAAPMITKSAFSSVTLNEIFSTPSQMSSVHGGKTTTNNAVNYPSDRTVSTGSPGSAVGYNSTIASLNGNTGSLDDKNESTGVHRNETTIITESTNGSTTFDPDPLFKAEAPVIKKTYNDKVLLSKMGTMAPLTEKLAFYTITIPTSIAILTAVMGCMCCLHIDCFTPIEKKGKSCEPTTVVF